MKPKKEAVDFIQLADKQLNHVLGGMNSNSNSGGNTCSQEGAPLRSSPSNEPGNVIVTMKKGERVSLMGGGENGFVQISYKGISGWASSGHIS